MTADKPPIIEAVKWNGMSFDTSPMWMVSAMIRPMSKQGAMRIEGSSVNVKTPLGIVTCLPGDYIIKADDGSLTSMHAAAFERIYQEVK